MNQLRVLALLLTLIALAACGPEAPPRASEPTTAPRDTRLRPSGVTVVPAAEPAPASERDQRGLGDPRAPITITAYSDFQCPFCSSFAQETMPLLKEQYIDTGLVYFQYRDLPLTDIHPSAVMASHVAGCAAEQGAFWPMHDRLFAGTRANEWGGGEQADFGRFLGYADELGLDREALSACVQSNRRAGAIEADVREAWSHAFRSTPSFLINGQPFIGAQPFQSFQRTLDRILAQQ